jgi:N-acetylglucosamine-6-phosphate deacetylase
LAAAVNKSSTTVIEAGTLLTPLRHLSPGRIIISGHSIAEAGPAGEVQIPTGAETIDASDLIVTPGFIDPHIHGCGGVDVMEATFESLNAVSRIIARHGTTAFLPTTVSSPVKTLNEVVRKLGNVLAKTFEGATPVGIHLEGPFINPAKRGTHKEVNVSAPDPALLNEWIRLSHSRIRLITVAPELDGIDGVLTLALASGITTGMGHSNATLEQAHAAARRGVCYAVHTFNAMREFAHREPGIVGEVLSNDGIVAEIIADGVHVAPAVVRLFARAKQKTGVLLATDAISATDMPDGSYILGTDTVNVINGVCRDADGRLAGSTLSQEIALKNFVEWSGWTLEDALLGLTLNPARALKLENKGNLEPGADADIAVLDGNFRVVKTFVGGKLVWTN